jgi:hypothetical protein
VFEHDLSDVVAKLVSRQARVWLVIDTPGDTSFNPIAAFERNPPARQFGVLPLSQYSRRKDRERTLFESLSAAHDRSRVRVIAPSVGMCDERACFGGTRETLWFRDADHLTDAGARTATIQFEAVFAVRP